MKIRPLAVGLFCADGRTDRHDEADSRSSQFCERSQKVLTYGMPLWNCTQSFDASCLSSCGSYRWTLMDPLLWTLRPLKASVSIWGRTCATTATTTTDTYNNKSLKKNLETVPGKHSIDSLQKTAVLGTSHIIRKVLQCEAWSLSGGDHRWCNRSTRKKCLWQETSLSNNNNNNKLYLEHHT